MAFQPKVAFGNCRMCGNVLVPIGHARVKGAKHNDWSTRKLHKKCWKMMSKLGMHTLRVMENFPEDLGETPKKQPKIVAVPDEMLKLLLEVFKPRLDLRNLIAQKVHHHNEPEMYRQLEVAEIAMRERIPALEAPAREKLKAIGMETKLINEFIETALLLCDNAQEFITVCHVYYAYIFDQLPSIQKRAHYHLYYKVHHSEEFIKRYHGPSITNPKFYDC